MNILLVDDEKLNLDILNLTVGNVLPDAKLNSFQHAMDAMLYIKEHKVDIAFLDINMRVVDGLTMAREILELYPTCNVIFCTGFTDYALDAWDINTSGYVLKPITEEKIRNAVANLRYEIEEEKKISFRCFGNFEVYCDGKPVSFKYNRTKEFLAYLVDRNGVKCSMRELSAVLFEDAEHRSYLSQIRLDLINTFAKLGAEDVILQSKGSIGIDKDKVKCDYYDYLETKEEPPVKEYMSQFSFAEITYAMIFMGD